MRRCVSEVSHDLDLSTETTEKLERRLLQMNHRTYLWLYLAMDEIRTALRDSLVPETEIVESLPVSVEEAYTKILDRVTQKNLDIVKSILLIVVAARRALTTGELALALGIAMSQTKSRSLEDLAIKESHLRDRIRQWCGLFVFIKDSCVHLIHQTAKEFLLRGNGETTTNPARWDYRFRTSYVEAKMAKICVFYLCLYNFLSTEWKETRRWPRGVNNFRTKLLVSKAESSRLVRPMTPSQQEFFRYCVEFWASHFNDQDAMQVRNLLSSVLLLYDKRYSLFRSWFYVMHFALNKFQEYEEVEPHHAAAYNGQSVVLDELYHHQRFDVDALDDGGRTALVWAVMPRTEAAITSGQVLVLKWLLEKGANVVVPGQALSTNPLQEAAREGNAAAVRVFLDAGVGVNLHDDYCCTALTAASARGQEEMVQYLLEVGADVHAQDMYPFNALTAASDAGHERVVKILLHAGAEAYIPGRSPLPRAAEVGNQEIVKMLLAARKNTDAQDIMHSAFILAALTDRESIVRMLLDAGVDAHREHPMYGNALIAASIADSKTLVRLLLDLGVAMHTRSDVHNNDAIVAASYFGHDEVAEILLSRRFPGPELRQGIRALRSLIMNPTSFDRALIDISDAQQIHLTDRLRSIGFDPRWYNQEQTQGYFQGFRGRHVDIVLHRCSTVCTQSCEADDFLARVGRSKVVMTIAIDFRTSRDQEDITVTKLMMTSDPHQDRTAAGKWYGPSNSQIQRPIWSHYTFA